jgi:ubiquinone/menaquinone biosynthesis C-methylase UbiE
MSVDFDQIKEGAKAMWSLGDYRVLAKYLEPAARDLVEACGISPKDDVLDVAAGNGNCAIAAARMGARVVASDLTPAQVELGRARTAAEGLDIDWTEADAEDLPFGAGRFDCVTSVFGAMTAPRQETVASELFRVVKPGGTVGMANWTQESFMKKMGDVGSKYSPLPPPGVPDAFRWGEEEAIRSLFEGLASSIELDRRSLTWEYESWDEMRRVGESFGGTVMAKRMLPPEAFDQMNKDFEALFGELNRATDGRVVIENEYLRVVAHKA